MASVPASRRGRLWAGLFALVCWLVFAPSTGCVRRASAGVILEARASAVRPALLGRIWSASGQADRAWLTGLTGAPHEALRMLDGTTILRWDYTTAWPPVGEVLFVPARRGSRSEIAGSLYAEFTQDTLVRVWADGLLAGYVPSAGALEENADAAIVE